MSTKLSQSWYLQESQTSTRLTNIIKAIKSVISQIITQNCMIDTQRRMSINLSRYTQSQEDLELSYIILKFHFV